MSEAWKVRHRCLRKIRHPNLAAAHVAIEATPAKLGCMMVAYQCSHCLGWHIGNKKFEPPSRQLFEGCPDAPQ